MNTTAQGAASFLAGSMLLCFVAKCIEKNVFKPDELGNDFPLFFCFMNRVAIAASCAMWGFDTSTRARVGSTQPNFRLSIRRPACGRYNTIKKIILNNLSFAQVRGYVYNAPAKSGARIGVLEMYKATHDAPSVFFCVLTFAHPFFSVAVIIRAACRVMVSWMGAEKSAPVTLYAGYANPVQLTTSEIGVSGGGIKSQYKEAAIMATTLTQNSQFIWLIAAVRRDCPTVIAKIHHVAAESELEARRSLVRDHVCFFAGRICVEVSA